ncbi:MAG: DMT family transporter [Gemmatimonadales bacterium]|nr:DMT family transporter [Gemmatimonadales bacterium]
MRAAGRLEVLGAALLFSTGGAAIKATTLGAWPVAGLRSGIAGLVLLLLVPQARRGWRRETALVAAAYAATLTLFVAANKLTTSANAIFLQSTAPLYLLLLGPWLLRERLRRADLAVAAAVLAGFACVVLGSAAPVRTAPDPATGNALAAASGLAYAVTLLGLRWLGTRKVAPGEAPPSGVGAVALGNLLAFAACLPFALPMAPTATDWAVLTYLGVAQIALAYFLLTRGMTQVPALEASLLLLLEPALNPAWSWLLLGERPGAWPAVGGVLILGATTWRAMRAGARTDDAEG